MTLPVPNPVAYLAGSWTITRVLRDTAAGVSGTFSGTGTFTPDGPGLAYEERGMLDLAHWRGPAYRKLHYAPVSSERLSVTFEDGRYFHELDLRSGVWTARHPCGADLYEGRFTVVSADEWHQEWRVRSAAKDQLIRSVFSRNG